MTAAEDIAMRTQVSRVLRGLPLALAVLLRRFVCMYLEDEGPPAWLVFFDPTSREERGRQFLGRDPQEAGALTSLVQLDVESLSPDDFLAKWASDDLRWFRGTR